MGNRDSPRRLLLLPSGLRPHSRDGTRARPRCVTAAPLGKGAAGALLPMTVHERPVGATVEWYTPSSLFDALGWEGDLDPASPGADVVPWVPVARHYTRADDGLSKAWEGRVWLNPPYGPAGVAFVERMIDHGDGLLLLPARTETRIFQRAARHADAVCFLRDRLHFIRRDGFQSRASFASVLFAFGDVPAAFDDLGWTVDNTRGRHALAAAFAAVRAA